MGHSTNRSRNQRFMSREAVDPALIPKGPVPDVLPWEIRHPRSAKGQVEDPRP